MTRPTLFLRHSILNSRRNVHASSSRRSSSSPQRRAAAAHKLDAAPLKKFSDIPGPLALPMLRHSAHVLPRIGSFHHSVGLGLLEGIRTRYGDLVRLAKGSRTRPVLYVFDPEIMREVYESRATHTPSWEQSPLNQQRQKTAGQCPFHRNDENAIWAGIQMLFTDRNITKIYEQAFNDIAADFTHRLEQLRSNENTLNEELETEIYRWAIETIGVMVFGIRMGCLDGPVNFEKESKQTHTSLDDVTHQCSLSSRHPADLSTVERFVQISKQIADQNYLVRSEDTLKCDSETFNDALKVFDEHYCLTEQFLQLALDNLTEGNKEQLLLNKLRPLNERLLPLTADAFLAGVEPLVQTALSTLYHLSLNPAQQQRAHDEICWFHSHEVTSKEEITSNSSTKDTNSSKRDTKDVLPKDSIRDDLELSYIKGCGKEAMRLQPVTGGVIRRSFEEFSVRGYLVPEGVDIVLAHGVSSKEEKQWGRAKAFIPERWCDQDWGPLKSTRAHPLASKPFGEKCPMVGISEDILSSLLVKVLEKYRLEWHGASPNMVTTGVNKLQGPFYFVLEDAH